MNKKTFLCVATLTGLCFALTGCGKNKEKATPDIAATNTPVPTNTSTPTPTNSPTPTPTPTPENEWVYKIVQNGYYNAAAVWDEDENLIEYPTPVIGEYIYYNDCDEYYNNFVHETNTFNDATITLDDEDQHSGDNSVKISSRESGTKGFSGFALKFSKENAIPVTNHNNSTCTLGFWIYYQSDFGTNVANELTFCVWSNLDDSLDPVATNATDTPAEDADEAAKDLYELVKKENDYAAKCSMSKIATVTVPKETWTYVEVPFNISLKDANAVEDPMLAIATLGESSSINVTYYNPFYIDDITVTLDSVNTK